MTFAPSPVKPGLSTSPSASASASASLSDSLSDSLPASVPSSVFQSRSFSILETLVVYLKEKNNLKYRQIGILLNRNERTIWTCYHRATKKPFKPQEVFPESLPIPLKIFQNRKWSFSEALIKYLKENLKLSFHQIAILLNRDDRTIWTLYARYLKKKGSGGATK